MTEICEIRSILAELKAIVKEALKVLKDSNIETQDKTKSETMGR